MPKFARRFCPLVAFLLVAAWIAGAGASEKSASFRAAMESISDGELRQYVGTLADSRFEGRDAGTRGGASAAEYLRQRLQQLGLAGFGPGGGYFQPFAPNYRNVLAVLEGSDADLKHEYVLVGAHYDHVGYARQGGSRGKPGVLHPGADDNASGIAGLLETAEAFTLLAERPRRSIIFAFWDAEEKGLFGSKHFAAHPTVPLDRIVLAVNADMIGRLRDDRLLVFGTRTLPGLRDLVSRQNAESQLRLEFSWDMLANADYHPFFDKRVPVLGLHNDLHEDYHLPTDTPDRINSAGMRRITRLMFGVVHELAQRDQLPRFREASRTENEEFRQSLDRPHVTLPSRLGVSWESQASAKRGLRLLQVAPDSAAEKAGLRPGDRVLQFAGREVLVDEDLQGAVLAAPRRTTAVVERAELGKVEEVPVELLGAPMRLGFLWRGDEAEPGVLVVTHVAAGSPAARAGVQVGDRICGVNGKSFSTDAQLAEELRNLPGPLRLQVEREGRVRSVEVRFEAVLRDRAA